MYSYLADMNKDFNDVLSLACFGISVATIHHSHNTTNSLTTFFVRSGAGLGEIDNT